MSDCRLIGDLLYILPCINQEAGKRNKKTANRTGRYVEKTDAKEQVACTSKDLFISKQTQVATCNYDGTIEFLPLPYNDQDCNSSQTNNTFWPSVLTWIGGKVPEAYIHDKTVSVGGTSEEKTTFSGLLTSVFQSRKVNNEHKDSDTKPKKNKTVCILVSHKDRILQLFEPVLGEKMGESTDFCISPLLLSKKDGNWCCVPLGQKTHKNINEKFKVFLTAKKIQDVDIIVCEHGPATTTPLDAFLTPEGIEESKKLGELIKNYYARNTDIGTLNIILVASHLNRSQHTALLVAEAIMPKTNFPLKMQNLLASFNDYTKNNCIKVKECESSLQRANSTNNILAAMNSAKSRSNGSSALS